MLGTILLTAANAVLPIVALILLGYFLRSRNVMSDSFVKEGNRLGFRLFLPVMLFVNVYEIPSLANISWGIVIFCSSMVCILFLLGMGIAAVTTKVPRQRGVILQCAFRSNFAIIGIPLSLALGGQEALALASILAAFTVPLFNILAVFALSIYSEDHKIDWKKVIGSIIHNPLILGVVLGLGMLGLRGLQETVFGRVVFSIKRDLPFLFSALNSVKAVTTPLALIVLGGGFTFSAVRGLLKQISVATVWRLVVAPAFSIGCAFLLSRIFGWFPTGTAEYAALIAMFGSPVAVSSAVMAREMGADHQLATQLVVWTSILSIISIFGLVCFLMAVGLIV